MIEIRITDEKLDIRGHAGYAKDREDIVCAAVSILAYTFMQVEDVDVLEYTEDSIVVTYEKGVDTSFIMTGFRLIAKDYPENVRILT